MFTDVCQGHQLWTRCNQKVEHTTAAEIGCVSGSVEYKLTHAKVSQHIIETGAYNAWCGIQVSQCMFSIKVS